jgi:hypothetical protein
MAAGDLTVEEAMALFRRVRKPAGKPGEWYYCLEHKKVEEGPQCPAKDRFGPYSTPVEAGHALQLAQERDLEWETDPRWHDQPPGKDD